MEIQVLKIKPVYHGNDLSFKAIADILLNFGHGDFVLIRDWRIIEHDGVIEVFPPGLRFRSRINGGTVHSKLISLPAHLRRQVETDLRAAYRLEGTANAMRKGENGTDTDSKS